MGTPIEDVDNDGLDDSWERGTLGIFGQAGSRTVMQTGHPTPESNCFRLIPKVSNHLFRMELLPMDEDQLQLSGQVFPGMSMRSWGFQGWDAPQKFWGLCKLMGDMRSG